MALTDLKGYMIWPQSYPLGNNQPTLVSHINNMPSGDKDATVFRIPKSGSVASVTTSLRFTSSTPSLTATLETVDASTGLPTGTLIHADATATLSNLTSTGTRITFTFSSAVAVTRGQEVAVVFTSNNTPSGQFALFACSRPSWDYPYGAASVSSVWTKYTSPLAFGVVYDDGTYGVIPDVWPGVSQSGSTFNSASSPNERGVKFQLPFGARCIGVVVGDATAADETVSFYASDGTTVLASYTFDKDVRSASAATRHLTWPSPITLSANTYYRFARTPTTATSISDLSMSFGSVEAMDAMPLGRNWSYTTRTGSGAWTDDQTKRFFWGLILDQIDVGGGLIGGGNLNGGFI